MDIFPSRNTYFIPKIFLLPSWKVTCFFSIISSFPQVIQLHVTITRKMSLVLTQEELVTTFHGTRKNKQVLALDSLWLNPKLVGKGFNWYTHLVHLTEKFSTIKSSYTFRIKCLITWLTQKQDFLFKEFLILSQKTQFLNRKHFRCPIWCPFLMHPLPSPPKKKILFYPENPPNFQMKTLSTSL